jgi:hypothetical protein
MPPFVIPPLIKIALTVFGTAAVVHWVVKEVRRVNEEMLRARAIPEPIRRDALPTLRRDPDTGEYRLK